MSAHKNAVSPSQLIRFGAAAFFSFVAAWPPHTGQILYASLLCVETMQEPDKGGKSILFSHNAPPNHVYTNQ
jgi:hypothetical protein